MFNIKKGDQRRNPEKKETLQESTGFQENPISPLESPRATREGRCEKSENSISFKNCPGNNGGEAMFGKIRPRKKKKAGQKV